MAELKTHANSHTLGEIRNHDPTFSSI